MIVHRLAENTDELIGWVNAADFNRTGSLLAYTVGSSDKDGNGLFIINVANGQHKTVDNAKADFSRMTWDTSGTAIAALLPSESVSTTNWGSMTFTGERCQSPRLTQLQTWKFETISQNRETR